MNQFYLFDLNQNLIRYEIILLIKNFYLFVQHFPFLPQIRFSLISQDDNGRHNEIESVIESQTRKEFKVLIVDDDSAFSTAFLNTLLEITNFNLNPEIADSANMAIMKLEDYSDKYDVIFIDIVLREENGIVVYDKSEELGYPEKRIIMMTSAREGDPEVETVRRRNLKIHDKIELSDNLSKILLKILGDSDNE